MSEQMLTAVDVAKKGLQRLESHINGTSELPNPHAVLSNAALAFDVLRAFYSDPDKAIFLPASITGTISVSLNAINSLVDPISVSADDPSAYLNPYCGLPPGASETPQTCPEELTPVAPLSNPPRSINE
jgi:hypothetical protein